MFFSYWMLFSSIERINRLISKGMLNISLKVTIEKNWRSQNFDFLSLKKLSVFGELQLTRISLNFKTSFGNLKIRGLEAKMCVAFRLNFEKSYDVLKSKRPCS